MLLKSIEQSFSVTYEYKLYFTQQLFDSQNTVFRNILEAYKKGEKVKVLFIVDDGVVLHHPDLLKNIKTYCEVHSETIDHVGTMTVKGGEHCKNDQANGTAVLEKINALSICRHSMVAVIGGGAVIDMVGFAAAIAHRGVKLIRIPTTVLSQNDSAVGVKNSINFFGKKNFLGTFAPPFAIINDSNFLHTLEQRDWIAGIAEAIKVALIKDEKFFVYLEEHAQALRERDMDAMQYVIYKCAEMHMHHIAQGGDPFESGSSRPLDFGHWAAHKLEQLTNFGLRHGEAVAKGIALDVTYAQLSGLISEADQHRILAVMKKIGFDLHIPMETDIKMHDLLAGIQEFREHLGGELCITLISDIGKKHDVNEIDLQRMRQAVRVLNAACNIEID